MEEKTPPLAPAWLLFSQNQQHSSQDAKSNQKDRHGRHPLNRSQTYHMFQSYDKGIHFNNNSNPFRDGNWGNGGSRTDVPSLSSPVSPTLSPPSLTRSPQTPSLSPSSSSFSSPTISPNSPPLPPPSSSPSKNVFPRPLNRSFSADQGKLEKLNDLRQVQTTFDQEFPTLSANRTTSFGNEVKTSQESETVFANLSHSQTALLNKDPPTAKHSKESVWSRKHSSSVHETKSNASGGLGSNLSPAVSAGELSKQERAKLVPSKPYHPAKSVITFRNSPDHGSKRKESPSSNLLPINPVGVPLSASIPAVVGNGSSSTTISSPPLSPHQKPHPPRPFETKNPKLDDIRKNLRKMTSSPSLPIHGPAGEAARMEPAPKTPTSDSPNVRSPVNIGLSPRSPSDVNIVERPEPVSGTIGNRIEFLETIRKQDSLISKIETKHGGEFHEDILTNGNHHFIKIPEVYVIKNMKPQNLERVSRKGSDQHDNNKMVVEEMRNYRQKTVPSSNPDRYPKEADRTRGLSEVIHTQWTQEQKGVHGRQFSEEEERFLKELGWEDKSLDQESDSFVITEEEKRSLQLDRDKIQRLREEKKLKLEQQMKGWNPRFFPAQKV